MKRDFRAILLHLAKYLKIKHDLKGDVNESFITGNLGVIAGKLGVKSNNLSVWKKRNSIPHEVILDFCLKEGINPLNVFYDKKVVF